MNETAESPVLLAREGAVALITLNRPRVRNAMNHALLDALAAHIAEVERDPGLRAVVIAGAGDRAFSAGADFKALDGLDEAGVQDWIGRGHAVFDAVEALSKPVVAAITGFALGGGLELALACDLRVADESAMLGAPEVSLGWLPGWGGMARLRALVGPARARDLVLTARRVGSAEALRLGLVDRLAPAGAAPAEALALARQMASYRPRTLALAKRALSDPSLGRDFDAEALITLRRDLAGDDAQ